MIEITRCLQVQMYSEVKLIDLRIQFPKEVFDEQEIICTRNHDTSSQLKFVSQLYQSSTYFFNSLIFPDLDFISSFP
jgi:hypothetical protein